MPPLKIATWNVNGIRARESQVLEWVERERPDVVCLQELKSTVAQVPPSLCELQGYRCYWHGERAYSGVGLHIRRDAFLEEPRFLHPTFDYETRIVTAQMSDLSFVSVYVPNGGKDFPAKMKFLGEMERYVAEIHASGRRVVLCGDINITRSERDVHPKERNPALVGQRPEEREMLERILAQGLVVAHKFIIKIGCNFEQIQEFRVGSRQVVVKLAFAKQHYFDVQRNRLWFERDGAAQVHHLYG